MYRRYSSAPVGGNTDSHKPEVSGAPRHGGGFDRAGQNPSNGASFGNPRGSCGDSRGRTSAEHWPPHCPENKRSDRRDNRFDKKNSSPVSPLLKFIPQSIYNPDTGKVLGFLSAEDLLIVALILLLIDNRDSDEDDSLLIYALVYILISDRINLPF